MGRVAPKNRKPRYCPECGGTMTKKGHYKRQQWECRVCHKLTQFPDMTRRVG